MPPTLKHPSAWIPIALSLAMLAFILTLLAIRSIPTAEANADEGAGAHLFQIWLVLEAFMTLFFAAKWLPRKPKDALLILTIQILAVVSACAPVRIFRL